MRRIILTVFLMGIIPAVMYAKDYKSAAIKTDSVGTVPFPHDPHLKKLGSNCTLCHNSLFKIGEKNPTYTMTDMEKGKSCGQCHNKVQAFGLSECGTCHLTKEISIKIPDFGTVIFSHKFHLALFSCTDCHVKLFKADGTNQHVTMKEMERGVSCGGCHDGKAAFSVTGSCTKCHAVKDITFDADALFNHKFHLDAGFQCTQCHSQLFVAGPNSKRYLMRDMETGRSCGGCHNSRDAFSVKGDCQKCHLGLPDVSFTKVPAKFSHKIHTDTVKKMYVCTDCHSGIFTGGKGSRRYNMEQMDKDLSCGACHDANIAFSVNGSCDRCHSTTKNIIFNLPNAGKVEFSHSFHTAVYKCDDCHNRIFKTGVQRKSFSMAQMEKGKSCGACHDGKTAFSVAKDCSKCHPVKEISFAADARFPHLRHLEMYSCSDCHNAFFTPDSLNRRFSMAEMEKDRSCGACHDAYLAFSVKGDCGRCHKTTKEISFPVKETGATIFSHKFHTELYKCEDCHYSIFPTGKESKRHTMSQMEAGSSCGACHDGKTAFTVKATCDRCHPTKEIQFRDSGALFSHKFHTGIYRCNDCHDKTFVPSGQTRRYSMTDMENGLSCGLCHNGTDAFTVKDNCQKCHPVLKSIRYDFPPKKNVETVTFSHKVHMGRGYRCGDCHYTIVPASVNRKPVTMANMNVGKSCGACHGHAMAFSTSDPNNCDRCHKPPEYE
ncbi:MAG: cytochrome c3 family protein [Geobacteraceae bacterium]|nr:cytochrome c3 family protein [Geobacteraceae bacterium]